MEHRARIVLSRRPRDAQAGGSHCRTKSYQDARRAEGRRQSGVAPESERL